MEDFRKISPIGVRVLATRTSYQGWIVTCLPGRRERADRIRFPGRRKSVRGAFGKIILDLHAPENELRPA
jgi:hypothetical protein